MPIDWKSLAKETIKDELVMARDLQAELVPRVLLEIGAFELGAFNRIANTVGGDLYAFEPLADGRLAVLFGDASGHGIAEGARPYEVVAALVQDLDLFMGRGAADDDVSIAAIRRKSA